MTGERAPRWPTHGTTDSLLDVAGLRVGQIELGRAPGSKHGATGVSVVVAAAGAIGAVDVRGAAPGSRETDALSPRASGDRVHAVLLVGRSVFGLAAADGAAQELERRNIGLRMAWDEADGRPAVGITIPIVAAAVVFDFASGDPAVRPRPDDGRRAVAAALDGAPERPRSGPAGAGAGAWTGGIVGPRRKGGTGHASLVADLGGGSFVVGALVVVNAAGQVDPAGAFALPGPIPDLGPVVSARGQTTLAVVGTDARLTKVQLAQVAAMAHDGLARVIRPIHSGVDGDAVFALSTAVGQTSSLGQTSLVGGSSGVEVHRWSAATVTIVGSLAADAVAQAVGDAMRSAED